MGTREVYEEKLRRGNVHDYDPTMKPGLGSPRCPRCFSLLNPTSVTDLHLILLFFFPFFFLNWDYILFCLFCVRWNICKKIWTYTFTIGQGRMDNHSGAARCYCRGMMYFYSYRVYSASIQCLILFIYLLRDGELSILDYKLSFTWSKLWISCVL